MNDDGGLDQGGNNLWRLEPRFIANIDLCTIEEIDNQKGSLDISAPVQVTQGFPKLSRQSIIDSMGFESEVKASFVDELNLIQHNNVESL